MWTDYLWQDDEGRPLSFQSEEDDICEAEIEDEEWRLIQEFGRAPGEDRWLAEHAWEYWE